MNKIEELKYAAFFLSQINNQNDWDYIAIPNENEAFLDKEIDVYAKSNTYENLNLQIKIIDKMYMPSLMERQKEAVQSVGGESTVYVRDLDPIGWAKKTLLECSKKYEPSVRKNMILLLCVYYGGKIDQDYAKREFKEYTKLDFRAVYLIDPPRGDDKYAGQITPVKALIL